MDEPLDPRDVRALLRNVGAYRQLRQHVRQRASWGLGFGAFMLAFWYFILPNNDKFGPFGLSYLGLAALEFTVALWNKVRPSAEGVLFDGLVTLTFGVANLGRVAMLWQQNAGNPSPVSLVFGIICLASGLSTVRSYAQLRRAFSVRPTAEQLRWFDGLIRDVRAADPEADPTALDLPTRPPVRGKMLGDSVFFLQAGSDELMIAGREDVEIERAPAKSPGREPVGYLIIHGQDFGGFPLDPDNWRNYAAWKGHGGEPPVVRRAGPDTDD